MSYENVEGEDEKLIYDEKPDLPEPRSKPRHIWILLGVLGSILLILIVFFWVRNPFRI
jgi:hypothetical protein